MEEENKHFVLVHGACLGAWSWYKVESLLKEGGHKVTALDMGASGIHPKQYKDIVSISDYYEPLMDFMSSLGDEERVILVGHSLGGVCISVAMERFPRKVSLAVFAAAVMPGPNLSYPAFMHEFNRRVDPNMDLQYTFDDGPDSPPTSVLFGPKHLALKLYPLSPSEDLTLALSLVRPCRICNDKELLEKETKVTKEKYGSVPKAYIVCDQDTSIREDLQRWMIERNPPDEVKVITGSDHMIMCSKPAELSAHLQELAYKFIAIN